MLNNLLWIIPLIVLASIVALILIVIIESINKKDEEL